MTSTRFITTLLLILCCMPRVTLCTLNYATAVRILYNIPRAYDIQKLLEVVPPIYDEDNFSAEERFTDKKDAQRAKEDIANSGYHSLAFNEYRINEEISILAENVHQDDLAQLAHAEFSLDPESTQGKCCAFLQQLAKKALEKQQCMPQQPVFVIDKESYTTTAILDQRAIQCILEKIDDPLVRNLFKVLPPFYDSYTNDDPLLDYKEYLLPNAQLSYSRVTPGFMHYSERCAKSAIKTLAKLDAEELKSIIRMEFVADPKSSRIQCCLLLQSLAQQALEKQKLVKPKKKPIKEISQDEDALDPKQTNSPRTPLLSKKGLSLFAKCGIAAAITATGAVMYYLYTQNKTDKTQES